MERGQILMPYSSPGVRVAARQIKFDPKNCIFNPFPARLHHLRCWSKGRKTNCEVFPLKSSADFSSSLAHCHQTLPAINQLLSTQLYRLSSHLITLLKEMESSQRFIWSWVFSVSGGRFPFLSTFSPNVILSAKLMLSNSYPCTVIFLY